MIKLYKETEIIPIDTKIWDRDRQRWFRLNEEYFIQVEQIGNRVYVEYAGNCDMSNLTPIKRM